MSGHILVTGGAGFIGSHTCKALAAEGFVPVAFDDLSRGHAAFVRWGPLVQGDILDPAALAAAFARYRPAAIIHFAALAYVGESVEQPLAYYRINVAGLINVLDAMLRFGTPTIVFSSSCATYGIPATLPVVEDAPQIPISPYGRSKLACEHILADVAAATGLAAACLRYFNAAGADPDGELVERHRPETHLIPLAIDAATGQGPPLSLLGTDYPTADGTCERDFIHVCDLAQAHVAALRRLQSGKASLTLNLGSGRASSVRSVIAAVERISGRKVPTVPAARRPGDPPVLVADISAARRTIGFEPRLSDLAMIVETAFRSRRPEDSDVRGEIAQDGGRMSMSDVARRISALRCSTPPLHASSGLQFSKLIAFRCPLSEVQDLQSAVRCLSSVVRRPDEAAQSEDHGARSKGRRAPPLAVHSPCLRCAASSSGAIAAVRRTLRRATWQYRQS